MCAGSRIDRFPTRTRGPKVLFVVFDDLNDWVGPLQGHPQAYTPAMDSVARRGVTITNAHVQAPLCNPSRASFLTGLRPSTTGHLWIGAGHSRSARACRAGHPAAARRRALMPPRHSTRSSTTDRFPRRSVRVSSACGARHHQCRCPRSAWHHRPARPAKWRGSWTGGSSPNGEPPRLSRRTTRATTPCGRIAGHAEARRERRTRSGSRGGAERAVPLVSWFLRSLVPSFPTCLSPPQNLHLRDARRIARSATCAPPHFGRWAFSAWPRSCEA
jgi:hypothetical protein